MVSMVSLSLKKIDEWARHVMMEKRKQTLGIVTQTKNAIMSSLHMILAGNPGMGENDYC